MTTQPQRTDDERVEALQAVGYELRMMAHASVLLRRAQLADDDPMAQNAFLESALLHARALIDFFLKNSTRGTDIRRIDFAPEWSPQPAGAVNRLDGHCVLLHKYLAHLTWERVDKNAPAWNYPDIATDVIDVADAWSQHVASSADRIIWEAFRPQVYLARQTTTT